MSKSIEIAELTDFIITISQIQCKECKFVEDKEEEEPINIAYTCRHFYDLGWRVKNEKVYCKKCIK